jgi:DNA polymerase (family 10)
VGARVSGAPGKRATPARSEPALYEALGLPFIPPELRHAELTHAEHDDFSDLIEERDILGAVHCHTTHSDGKNSIEEMARAAQELGLQYITITDHSPSAFYAHGVTLDRLQQQWDEIRDVEQKVGIRILRGTESDILADGSLDFPLDVLGGFDIVIASIHSRLRMSRADMTARLVRAMQQPVFKIWGHALGRLLLAREPIDCDVEAVLDALAASRGAIEINGDPHRLDLPPHWIGAARARNIPFVLSVDAHSTRGLGVLPFAVTMARRGGLRRGEVLNALAADAFAARVRPS